MGKELVIYQHKLGTLHITSRTVALKFENKLVGKCIRISLVDQQAFSHEKLICLISSGSKPLTEVWQQLSFEDRQTLKPKCHLFISSLVNEVFSLIFRINFLSFCSSRFSCNFDALTPIFSACFCVSQCAQLCEIYKMAVFFLLFCCLKSFFFNQTECHSEIISPHGAKDDRFVSLLISTTEKETKS